MLAAYPLIFLADVITQRLLQKPPEKQAIVDLFNASSTLEQRVLIIVLAVSVAPLAEEFIFPVFSLWRAEALRWPGGGSARERAALRRGARASAHRSRRFLSSESASPSPTNGAAPFSFP